MVERIGEGIGGREKGVKRREETRGGGQRKGYREEGGEGRYGGRGMWERV